MTNAWKTLFPALFALLAAAGPARAQTSTWRPVVAADHGMIASGHPLASEAGLRLLKSGGNAIDAAIAAWAVQGLVEPMMTGIGGDEELALLGHKLDIRDVRGVGSVKGILIHPGSGVLMGGVSPTGDSYVTAW